MPEGAGRSGGGQARRLVVGLMQAHSKMPSAGRKGNPVLTPGMRTWAPKVSVLGGSSRGCCVLCTGKNVYGAGAEGLEGLAWPALTSLSAGEPTPVTGGPGPHLQLPLGPGANDSAIGEWSCPKGPVGRVISLVGTERG